MNAQKVAAIEEINRLQTNHQQLQEEFSDLQNKKENLERRILEIGQKNPNLSSLEQLQGNIEKISKRKTSFN